MSEKKTYTCDAPGCGKSKTVESVSWPYLSAMIGGGLAAGIPLRHACSEACLLRVIDGLAEDLRAAMAAAVKAERAPEPEPPRKPVPYIARLAAEPLK